MDHIAEITRLLHQVHESQQKNVGQTDVLAQHYTQVAQAMTRQAEAMTRQAEALEALAAAIVGYTAAQAGPNERSKNVVVFPGRQGA